MTVLPWDLIGKLLNRDPFLSPKRVRFWDGFSGRGEIRRVTSKSASAFQKKNDAAHATAKLKRRSDKRKWRYKEVAGVLVKQRLVQEWRSSKTRVTA